MEIGVALIELVTQLHLLKVLFVLLNNRSC